MKNTTIDTNADTHTYTHDIHMWTNLLHMDVWFFSKIQEELIFLLRHCKSKYRKICLAKVKYTYQQTWYLKKKKTTVISEYNLFYTNPISALGIEPKSAKFVCIATKQRESHLRAQIHFIWDQKRNFLHWLGNVNTNAVQGICDKYEV